MRKRRRFAPSASAMEPRYALDAEGCDYGMPAVEVEVSMVELPDIDEIFADDPASWEESLPPGDDPERFAELVMDDFVDTLPDLDPLGPAPPDLEDGQPPFVPLPDAPIGPAGPA